jgi:hypothetical protein
MSVIGKPSHSLSNTSGVCIAHRWIQKNTSKGLEIFSLRGNYRGYLRFRTVPKRDLYIHMPLSLMHKYIGTSEGSRK